MSTTTFQSKPLSAFDQQDAFLKVLMEKKTPTFIFLKNGVRLKGFIEGFDNHIILFSAMPEEQKISQQLIYKHAISTITGNYSLSRQSPLSK